uniref:Retrovirus-related Pol polyprotein from transposon opus n=1 Tax=Cajanus cajan TaxID=3821 RepID=A0A151QT33_CAJCA|nr:Retrovirus-related Pol polyprotein from transposon opus [Cajanus cajan]
MDNWKSLPIDKYDGTTDPDEHLDVFLTQVTLSTIDDAALCRIFPTSLKGRALSWFTRLPPNSIDSFSTLSSQFTIQFATSCPHKRVEPVELKVQFQIGVHPVQVTYIGADMSEEDRSALCEVILKNKDLFAWTPSDMPDRLVDGASGHGILTFLDAYSGYNQIPMHSRDEEKTAFITDSANYCYQVMPFGLKNAGATYQRLMNKVFQHQIGRNMEVYVDDMVVKSRDLDRHVVDLSEVFQQLRKYDMRLNPEKCVFGVSGGKFLGFMLSARGIEANPDKCMAIINMVSPQSLKQVQQLAELHGISSPWPFAMWGMDILGPFPIAKGQCKFLLVAVDYFTKWVEAEPLSNITAANVQKFLWKNIVTRFEVLWAYRCTPQSTTKETPFRLTYGTDAMIPVEIGEPSFRRQHFDETANEASLRTEVDMIDEVRTKAQIIAEACKQRMARPFNSTLSKREFHEGDLVWRVQGPARRNTKEGKLAANWDDPFRIRHNLHNGAYKLKELSGKVFPRTWNATHLKNYYRICVNRCIVMVHSFPRSVFSPLVKK